MTRTWPLVLVLATPVAAAAQPPQVAATGSDAPAWSFVAREILRVESWRFFDPGPDGGEPDYTFAGNRLFLQAGWTSPRVDVTLAAQHVSLFGLPDRSIGPGALGTGPLYYLQGGERRSVQRLFPKYASVRLKRILPGLDIQAGRQAYASGAEAASGDPAIEAVKRQRLDARLVGEFEWSLYQRSFDGVRADWTLRSATLTGAWLMPTQGGFAREAETTMTDVHMAGATLTLRPSARLRRTTVQAFAWRYTDARDVTGRPDNTGRSAPRADVGLTTVGGAVVGAYPTPAGRWDVLGWLAVQTGRWYELDQRAVAVAAEAGHQWTRVRWSPWLRAGINHAGGDADPDDDKHGTFVPLLPTMRRFSQTTATSTMNLNDTFVQAMLRPAAGLTVRADWHRLRLADAADRWYAGSGATLATGGNFGYVTRPSNGSTRIGSSTEVSAAYAVSSHWSVNGFAGHIRGGPVVTRTFAGSRLWFVYVENTITLGGR